MKYRALGKTGFNVSEVSFGAWAIGGSWGDVSDDESLRALHCAIDTGVNFIDTADVYGDGRSERLIAQLRKDRPRDTIHVATKAGRRLNPHVADGYNAANLESFIDRSLKNLQTDALDLVQLHCPPTDVYYAPEVFRALDDLARQGKVKHYGVSVERVEEALKAIEFPNVKTVQIIFNLFRLRPTETFLPLAHEKQIGVLARVPLASGLLTGKITKNTQFAKDDHRNFNRHGEAFDVGETFSGVEFDTALAAVEELKKLVPPGVSLAQFALKWILMNAGVSCVIPGAKKPQQVEDNARASDLPDLSTEQMHACAAIYDRYIRSLVHHRW